MTVSNGQFSRGKTVIICMKGPEMYEMSVFRLGSRMIAWFFLEVTDLTAVKLRDACADDVGPP